MRERAKVRAATPDAIAQAATALRRGELIAFPTETVYGLGANATDDHAIAAVFAAKARPTFNPLIVHVRDSESAAALARFDSMAHALTRRFWPGPLTLVLPCASACPVSHLATAGLDTIAVRAPAHPVARELLQRMGVPIAAPSANPSGAISPTTAAHVAATLGDKVALILDGGPCEVGIESTVLDLTGDGPTILRPGGITHEALRDALAPLALAEAPARDAPKSPGTLASHYAPSLPLRLDATSVTGNEALLAFGETPPKGAAKTLNLSPTGDLTEAAANLFAMLRQLDDPRHSRIAVTAIPEHELGRAINDRLRRAAAAPRG